MDQVFVIKNALDQDQLVALAADCDLFSKHIGQCDLSEKGAALDPFEGLAIGDNHPARTQAKHYFLHRWSNNDINNSLESTDKKSIIRILLSSLPQFVSNFLDIRPLYLFNEHYIIKNPNDNIEFRWHTDENEQLKALSTKPEYWSCWCPIDDVSIENGTIFVPRDSKITYLESGFDRISEVGCGQKRKFTELSHGSEDNPGLHTSDEESLDDGCIALIVPAGSLVIFSSRVWHKSSVNCTSRSRRVFYAQYSSSPLKTSETENSEGSLLSFAIPCILRPTSTEESECERS